MFNIGHNNCLLKLTRQVVKICLQMLLIIIDHMKLYIHVLMKF